MIGYLCQALSNDIFCSCAKIWICFPLIGIDSSGTHTKEWYQAQAVLRVSLGNFLFFGVLALIMIGVKDQNDRRDSWHHGGWTGKIVIWFLLIVLAFFIPDSVMLAYGMLCNPFFLSCFWFSIFIMYNSNICRIHIEVWGWLVFIDSSANFTWLHPQLEWCVGWERWTEMVCWNFLYNIFCYGFLIAIVFLITLHV